MNDHHWQRLSATLLLPALVALSALDATSAAPEPPLTCPIPLVRGMQWTYEGTVRWTPVNSPPREATHVTWGMEVVDTATNQFSCAAIIRGMPDELAGYEDGLRPGLCVLFSISNRVYRLSARTEREARRKARELLQSPGKALSRSGPEFLALPLAKGKEWAGEGERDDHWYRWHVEAQRRERPQVSGFPTRDAVATWSLAYRTCPSHEVFDMAEGLGITRYVYEHHGTIQSVDVRLVSVKRPTVQ